MTNDELLKSYMDQLARDQQNYRNDMRAMQARMDAQQTRSDERMEAMQARMDAQQTRSDERVEALIRENRRDVRNTIWSGLAFAAAIFGTIVGLLLAFVR